MCSDRSWWSMWEQFKRFPSPAVSSTVYVSLRKSDGRVKLEFRLWTEAGKALIHICCSWLSSWSSGHSKENNGKCELLLSSWHEWPKLIWRHLKCFTCQLELLTHIKDEVVHTGKERSVAISSGIDSKTRNTTTLVTVVCPHPVCRSCLLSYIGYSRVQVQRSVTGIIKGMW